MRRLVRIAAAALLACSMAVLSATAEVGLTAHEIAIGSCADRSGPSKDRATAQLDGAKAYFGFVNEKGGIEGRKIVVHEFDDAYDPSKGIDCFNEMISAGSFAGGFFLGSPLAAKYVPMAQDHKIPVLGFISGAQFIYEPTKHYVFAVRASSLDALKNQVKHLWEDLGVRKFGVIYQNDAYGAHVLESAGLSLKGHGVVPVKVASYERGSLNVDGAVTTVREAGPQAVFLGAVGAPMAEIIKKAKASGFHPYFLTISDDPAFYKAGGKDVEGTIITQFVPSPEENLPSARLYKTRLAKDFPQAKPTFTGFEGFIDALVLTEGLRRAGPDLTREALVRALESMHDFDLGLGEGRSLTYGPNDHEGFNFVYDTVVRGGKPVPLRDWKSLKD